MTISMLDVSSSSDTDNFMFVSVEKFNANVSAISTIRRDMIMKHRDVISKQKPPFVTVVVVVVVVISKQDNATSSTT